MSIEKQIKFFLYNNKGIAPQCLSDTKKFIEDNIKSRDVREIQNFDFNTDGLNPNDCPTIVIGGGSLNTLQVINTPIYKSFPSNTVRDLVNKKGFNYLGICAGAYLGTAHYFFSTIYKYYGCEAGEMILPETIYLGSETNSHFDLFPGFKAIGNFSPNESYDDNISSVPRYDSNNEEYIMRMPIKPTPYSTKISFSDSDKVSVLYAGGCGFTNAPGYENQIYADLIATYSDKPSYSFDFQASKSSVPFRSLNIENFYAMISRHRNIEKNEGGVLLSGVHFEASVKDSAFFNFFKNTSDDHYPISEKSIREIEEDREKVEQKMTSIIKKTFSS